MKGRQTMRWSRLSGAGRFAPASGLFFGAFGLAFCGPAASAQVTSFTDHATFLGQTGALAEPEIPNVGLIGREGTSFTLGDMTFVVSATDTQVALIMQEWTALNTGNEVIMSSVEDLDVFIDHPVYSVGFHFVEGTSSPDYCSTPCPCTDTTYRARLLLQGAPVGEFQFNAPDDALAFYGLWSCQPFDHVEFRDLSGQCDNEVWGRFWLGATPGCGPVCDSIDFNNDGLFPDTADIDDFLNVFSGGPCSTDPVPGCGDIDFNNDGLFPDTADIDALLVVFSGGACV